MLTKDFIKEVEKLGLEVEEDTGAIEIYLNNERIAYVYRYEIFSANTAYIPFDVLSKEFVEKLYNLIDAYARTPLNEREEKKFYLKQNLKDKWLERNAFYYLNLNIDKNIYLIDSYASTDTFKTQFTQAEIDKIKEKFNTNLDDFEQIPVEEVEE